MKNEKSFNEINYWSKFSLYILELLQKHNNLPRNKQQEISILYIKAKFHTGRENNVIT